MKLSVIIPALDDRVLLAASLPLVLAELERLDTERELIVVDDTGTGALEEWLKVEFPSVQCLVREVNGGFGVACLSGAEQARGEVLCFLNPDVCVQPGFFAPLLERLDSLAVFAAAPLVMRDGELTDESLPHLEQVDGSVVIRRRESVEPGIIAPGYEEGYPVAFAIGGAFCVRREEFIAEAGFDPIFEPFYFEDVDLCWSAWRAGRRVVVDPRAVAEHSNRGTIGANVPERVVHAGIEKNRHLFAWKHLDGDALEAYLDGLGEELADAVASEDRERLSWFSLALDQLQAVLEKRKAGASLLRTHHEVLKELS